MMPQGNFSARLAFVDYDGTRILDLDKASTPQRREECSQFVRNAAPCMANGVEALRRFVKEPDG